MKLDIQKQKQLRISNTIDTVMSDLSINEAVDIRKFPENLFVNTFLPYFARETGETDQINVATWIHIAGHPFQPVDIVDHQGVTLYRVPPLFERNAIQQKDIDPQRGDLAHVLNNTTLLAGSHPMRGQNYFEREMNARIPVEEQHPEVLRNRTTWNEIFKRYGKPLIGQETPVTTTPEQPVVDNNTGVNYDDGELL